MGKIAGLWGGNAGILLGFVAAGVVLLGGYFYLSSAVNLPEQVALAEPEPVVPAPAVSEPTPTPTVSSDPETVPEPAPSEEVAVAEPSEPEPEPTPSEISENAAPDEEIAPEVAVIAPRFDLVRVEQDGNTLIAGKAAPDTEVVIIMDGKELGRVTSDGTGAFVSFNSIPDSSDARVLSLVSRNANGEVTSDDQVILAPSAPPKVAVADVKKPPVDEAKSEIFTSTSEPSDKIEETPEEPATAAKDAIAEPEEPTAVAVLAPTQPIPEAPSETTSGAEVAPPSKPVTVLRADADGVEVLQPATSDRSPEAMTSVALDAISYSDVGDVSLSGRAPDQGSVRIYLDNAPIATLEVDETGRWRGDLPQVETGVYTLRIDQVDASGAVTSRVETPFKREEPEVLSAALAQAGKTGAQVRAVTVQTGATLWAIARDRYGDGTLFVRVFDANRDSIRDPDLIYPGQVFALPE